MPKRWHIRPHDRAAVARAGVGRRLDLHQAGRGPRIECFDTCDREDLITLESERLGIVAWLELKRKHPHPDQVRTVDAFIGLGDHSTDSEQCGALGRPIPT